jgi:hypothetical protein
VAQWDRQLDYLTTYTSLSPIRRGFAPGFVNYKKGWTRLAAASDKAYQLLAHGRWFSPDTPASSTTKTDRHDIAEILLKVALNTKNQFKSIKWNVKFAYKISVVHINCSKWYWRINKTVKSNKQKTMSKTVGLLTETGNCLLFPSSFVHTGGLGLWYLTPLSKYFSYIVTVSFISGGNRRTRRKLSTCRKSLANLIVVHTGRYSLLM